MPRVKKLDLGMTALDELFMNDKERAENKLPKIFDIPLSEIDDFPGHPYRVLDDEDRSGACSHYQFHKEQKEKTRGISFNPLPCRRVYGGIFYVETGG